MNRKPIILVTGATGAQGGSVAHALLQAGKFKVRALTRDAASSKAMTLAEAGAEVVEGSLDDIKTLRQAMKDCYGVFGVTNYWEHFENEYRHGKNLIDAVSQSAIKHFVFSSLPDYFKLSQETLSVPHCDIKGQLQEYTRALGIPATFVHIAYYYENFLSFFPPQKGNDGDYYFGFPQGDTRLSMISVEDMGGVVAPIFDYPDEYIGRIVGLVGEDKTCHEYAAEMSEVLGKNIHYNYIPRDEYAAYGFPGAEELANMFEVQRLYIPNRQLQLIETYGLNPETQTFKTWLKKNKAKFANLWAHKESSLVY
ncbi:MAG: NmrA-like family domain containing 1 [Ferruginibacter sp.]|nr:NmrA-like family domain containing 1 [Ferruginibacter sp.]